LRWTLPDHSEKVKRLQHDIRTFLSVALFLLISLVFTSFFFLLLCSRRYGLPIILIKLRIDGMPVTLFDDERDVTCSSLDEAVEAAKAWYKNLAGDRLPTWNYEVKTVEDLEKAIQNYKTRLAKVLGYGADFETKLRLRLTTSEWHRA
jgi:hypothetical protein